MSIGLKPHRHGHLIGQLPRDISLEDLAALGHQRLPVLKIIREKCKDCCVGQLAEVRKCTALRCAHWPYRMGTNPLRKKKTTGSS